MPDLLDCDHRALAAARCVECYLFLTGVFMPKGHFAINNIINGSDYCICAN